MIQTLTQEDITKLKNYFLNKPQRFKANALRDYTWFVVALNTGLSPADFTKLKIKDILNEQGKIRDYLHITQSNIVKINQAAKEALIQYFDYKQNNNISYSIEDYCFVNYTSKTRRSDAIYKDMSVSFVDKTFYLQTQFVKEDQIVIRLKKYIVDDLISLGYNSTDISNLLKIALKTNRIPHIICDRYIISEVDNFESPQPLTTENVRVIMKRAVKEIGINCNIGAFSLKKTYNEYVEKLKEGIIF